MNTKKNALSLRPRGWKFDLPTHHETIKPCPRSKYLRPPPNHYDHIYLELSRSSLRVRGFSLIFGPPLFLMSIFIEILGLYVAIFKFNQIDFEIIAVALSAMTFLQLLILPTMRMDLELPRDEPIRFNRLRRKVYVYQYKYDHLRVFSRRRWGVQPEVYDWDDLHAEACSVYLPMGNGGLVENIIISVRKPGTDEVIDRFFFSHDWVEGQAYWTIAQLFMEQGPQALPDFVHPARDRNNEPTAFDFIPHFAPAVKWPEKMDRESRSAPSSEEVL